MKSAISRTLAPFLAAPRYIRISTYLLLSYAFYAVIFGLIVPAIIVNQAPKALTDLTGRTVQISEVKINPFILTLEINGFTMAEKESDDRFVGVAHLKTELNFWQSLMDLTPTLEYFLVQNPSVAITRLKQTDQNFRFNFSDIVEHISNNSEPTPSAPETKIAADEAAELFPFRAKSIQFTNAEIIANDNVTGVRFGYQNINLGLEKFDTRATMFSQDEKAITESDGEANRYAFLLNGTEQSTLKLDGQFQLLPLVVKGDVSLENLQLPTFWPLTEQAISANLASASMTLSSNYYLEQVGEQVQIMTDSGQFLLSNLAFNDKQTPKVTMSDFAVENISTDSAKKIVNIDKLSMNGLWVDAVLNGQGVDLQSYFTPKSGPSNNDKPDSDEEKSSTDQDILVEETSAEDKPKAANQEASWLVTLNAFEMKNTDINLKESLVSDGVQWRVAPLNISTQAIVSDLSMPLAYKIDFNVSSAFNKVPQGSRGAFSSEGVVDIAAAEVESQIQLSGLELAQFQRYLDPHVNITLNKGKLNTKGKISANGSGKANYDGQASIDQLLIKGVVEKEPLVKWKKMSIDSIFFDQQGKALKINTIHLNEPYAKVLIAKDKRTNVGEITSQPTATKATATNKETGTNKVTTVAKQSKSDKAFAFDINKIVIDNGSAFFADYSMTPNFASGIELLEGYIDNISSDPKTRAKVDIKGKIDQYAPVTLVGEVNPLIDPPYLDITFSLKGAELTSVNPYSGTYAGYYIDKGQLSLDINYQLDDNLLQGKNHVIVDQLTLGKKSDSSQATSLPVTLAVGLLSDSNGVIDLGFDVSGDVDSPEFSFAGAIMKVLGNIITKAVTAPFSLLADLVGSDDDLDFIEYEAGLANLDDSGQERLIKLSEALLARPGLKISVEGAVLPSEDSRALAEMALKQKLMTISGSTEIPDAISASYITENSGLMTAVETLFVEELGQTVEDERTKLEQVLKEKNESEEVEPEVVNSTLYIGMYNQLLSAQSITDVALGNLASQRAREVKTFLVSQDISSERVFILDSRSSLNTQARQALLTIDMN